MFFFFFEVVMANYLRSPPTAIFAILELCPALFFPGAVPGPPSFIPGSSRISKSGAPDLAVFLSTLFVNYLNFSEKNTPIVNYLNYLNVNYLNC